MRVHRSILLGSLAGLTLLFLLGAVAYANWGRLAPPPDENGDLGVSLAAKQAFPVALRLTVHESGIAAVTAAQLGAANFPVDAISAETVNLTRNGRSIPFHVAGKGAETALYFLAQAASTGLEAPAVYLLRPEPGAAMAQRDAAPTGPGVPIARHRHHWEENTSLLTRPNNDDLWLGPLILAPETWELALNGLDPAPGPATLHIHLWSNTQDEADPDHHVQVRLNGRLLHDWYWDGVGSKTVDIPVPAGALQADGRNRIALVTPGDTAAAGEGYYLDWIQLDYEATLTPAHGQAWFHSDAANMQIQAAGPDLLVFDVTDKANPRYLRGGEYAAERKTWILAGSEAGGDYYLLEPEQAIRPQIAAAPAWKSDLRAAQGADYVAIVADAPGFEEALRPLLAHRAAQGLQVTAVPLAQIYDQFGHGQPGPEAIRHFLAHAAAAWTPAPRYVLLVGDASYTHLPAASPGDGSVNLLPTAMVRTERDGYVASDAWYVQDAGGASRIAIGRFPAQNAAQAATMVEKTIAYETAGVAESAWTDRALLVADDEPAFSRAAADLAAHLDRRGYQIHHFDVRDDADVRYQIMSALNKGVGLVSYVGYGSEDVWGDEMVFQASDAAQLQNGRRLPIFAAFNCRNGAFAHPHRHSLAERMLRQEAGGIVAAVAPSGRADLDGNLAMADRFYRLLLEGEGEGAALGGVLQEAKRSYGAAVASAGEEANAYSDVWYLFNLLGDPALRVHLP